MRTTWKLIALAALAAAFVAAAASPAAGQERRLTAAKALEADLLAEVNEVRRANGVAPLRHSPQLTAAATIHSRAMATRGFFAHASADGTPFSRRVARFYGPTGHRYWSVGENLLWSSRDLGATRAVHLWLRSPRHRQNLLSARWREVGFSAVVAEAAPGTFGGRTVVIVTADFGVRR